MLLCFVYIRNLKIKSHFKSEIRKCRRAQRVYRFMILCCVEYSNPTEKIILNASCYVVRPRHFIVVIFLILSAK